MSGKDATEVPIGSSDRNKMVHPYLVSRRDWIIKVPRVVSQGDHSKFV